MRSINFVVLGEQTIANDFGKKGTTTDLTLYDKKESDIIRTWIVPNGYGNNWSQGGSRLEGH